MSGSDLPKRVLLKAAAYNPEGVFRLARFLGLDIAGMSERQVAGLIAWRLSPFRTFSGYFG